MNAITIKNLSKHFTVPRSKNKQEKQIDDRKKVNSRQNKKEIIRAVDNINFEIKKGEIFGFLGPNGAGKTTTIRMLTGILKPTNGNITVFGKNLWKNLLLVQHIMGHVPEMADVYLDLSGFQNLSLIGELYGIARKERKKRAENLLKEFELFEKRNLKAKKYSKGMKQRLLICMALISNPKLLFLDEPTSGLDVQSSIIIKKLIKEFNKTGMTIIMSTHDMVIANELCDRIAIIDKGKLVGLDSPENLKKFKQDYQAIDVNFAGEIKQSDLLDLKTVTQVREFDDYLHIIVSDIHEGTCEIIDYAKTRNLTIKKISTYEPKLEEVFLKLIKRGKENE